MKIKTFFIIIITAGFSCGLQAPLHYKYKYFGSISTGIPEISNQASGWAIKAELEVFLEKNDGIAIFKLNDVRTNVVESKKLGCDSRGGFSEGAFTEIADEDLSKAFHAPFRANLLNTQDFSIEYSENKYRWLVNFRKGIASIFANAVIRGNFEQDLTLNEGHAINVFTVEEETIFGKCLSEYVGHPIPEYLAGRLDRELKQQIEFDVQRGEPESSAYTSKTSKTPKKYPSKTSKKTSSKSISKTPAKYQSADVPELKDTLWTYVRTINFDVCKEIVDFQINSVADKEVSGGQVDWRRGRSSITEYVVRGSPRRARLERVTVEGSTTFSPFGFKTELLQARSNQTLQLVSVTNDGVVPVIPEPLYRSKTWMYEIWSFAEPPRYSKPFPWVVYTGEGDAIGFYQTYGVDYIPTDSSIKDAIIQRIKLASLKLSDLDQEGEGDGHGSSSQLMAESSYYFKFLSTKSALEVFSEFFKRDLHQSDILARKLVIDAAAASGHHHAIDAIMDYIIDNKIPDLQIMTIFTTLASNAQCAGSIPKILNWLITLDIKEKPFLTSTVAINVANLISEFCVLPQARNINYAGRIFGDNGCKVQFVIEKFEPFVFKLLQDEREWVKIVGIKVFSGIRTPFIVPALAPFIEGKVKCSNKLRIHAIYALEYFNFIHYDHLSKPIVDLLRDVYSDIGENVAVREAALYIVATWSSDASFYHTLARTSWREPSKRFASFITWLIKSTAEAIHPFTLKHSQAASHAVKFTRPVAPSPLLSHMFWAITRDQNRHIINLYGGSAQISKSLYDIIDISSFMMSDFGGLEVILLEARAIFESGLLSKNLISKLSETGKAEGITARIAKEFYDNIEETIKSKFNEHARKDSVDLYLLILNHLQLFLPFNEETVSKLPISDMTSIGAFMLQLSMGYDLVLGKYLNPIDYTSVHPTELGLPLFISGSTPTVITDVSYSSFATGSKTPSLEALKKSELAIESLISFSSEYRASIGVLQPWDKYFIKAGVVSTRDVVLPFKKTLRGEERHDSGHQILVHFDIKSLYKNKFSVVEASNLPYTSIIPILPLGDDPLKFLISKSPSKETLIPIPGKYTGLDLQLSWKSEASLPFTFWTPEELLSNSYVDLQFLFYAYASPTAKYWYSSLEFDPTKSATKNISLEFMSGMFGKSEPESLTQETGDFSQYGQEGFEQYDQEQQSFNPQEGFQEIGNNAEVDTLGHINYGDSIEQRSQKMQNHFGGAVKISSIKVNFGGNEQRSYEVLFSLTKSKIAESRKVTKAQISFVRSPIPYLDSNPASVCIDYQNSVGIFTELDTFESLLKENLDKESKTEITLGCKGEPVLVVKGSYHITDEWKTFYETRLHEACDADPNDPLYTFNHHAIYDELNVTYTWEKVCDPEHFPIMTKVLNIGRLLVDRISSNRCGQENPERKIQANIRRSLYTGNWFIDIQREDSKVSYESLPHSVAFDLLLGVGHKNLGFHPDHYSTLNTESEKCIVGVDRVRTFDGLIFDYNPSQCWTVAAKSCNRNDKMLLVRSSQAESTIPDAKYIDVTKGLVIEYIRNTLRVNGKIVDPVSDHEDIKNDDGKVLVSIYKKNEYYMAKLSEDSYISFKDKIEVHLETITWGATCGVCGNNDGESENDLVGPQRCFYNDPHLFIASWTAGSDTCDLYTLLELREQAEKFQTSESCKTVNAVHDSCPYFNQRCMKYGFKVLSENDNICVSTLPLLSCEDSCDIKEYETKQVTFRCWPVDYAPEELKAAVATNELSIREPLSYDAYFEVQKFVAISTTCKKF